MSILRLQNEFLPFPFRFSVNADRSRFITLAIGFALFAIKNVIGAEVDEPRVFVATNLRENARRVGVDPKRLFALRFAKIDIGEGGGVNHKIDIERAERLTQLLMIGEIELRMVETGDVKLISIFAHERGAQASASAKNYNLHFLFCAAV
jgi:hypothetical protein